MREAGPSVASMLARARELSVAGLLLVVALVAASPAAATGGAASDPSPQPAPATTGGSTPAPDPVPGTASVPTESSPTTTSSGSVVNRSAALTVTPAPSGGPLAVVTPRGAGSSSRARAHHASGPLAHLRRAHLINVSATTRAASALTAARTWEPFRFPNAVVLGTSPARPDGVLLLFSALALGVLVVASVALLRLLGQARGLVL